MDMFCLLLNFYKNNLTDSHRWNIETAYPKLVPEFSPLFSLASVIQYLFFCVVFCQPLVCLVICLLVLVNVLGIGSVRPGSVRPTSGSVRPDY